MTDLSSSATPQPVPKRAVILLLSLAVIWGSSFILMKRGLAVFSPDQVGALRIASGGLVLVPWGVRDARGLSPRLLLLLLGVGLLGSLAPAMLFASAQTHISSATAGILNALTPLFVLLWGVLWFRLSVTRLQALGLALGFMGACTLIFADQGKTGGFTFNLHGLLIVIATLCYGLNINLLRKYLRHLPARVVTSVSLSLVGVLAAVYLVVGTAFVATARQTPEAALAIAYLVVLGILGTALALFLFNHLIRVTTPLFASSVTYLIPVVAVFWGFVDGETFGFTTLMGMGGICTGIYLTSRT